MNVERQGAGPSRQAREKADRYLDFRAALRQVLSSGDVAAFKLFLRDSAEDFGDPDLAAMGRWTEDALLPLMHRMIIADAKLASIHAGSREWLRKRGMPFRVRPTGYGWTTELRQRYRSIPDRPNAASA